MVFKEYKCSWNFWTGYTIWPGLGRFMLKSVICSEPGYTSITCSKISNIPYNLIFTTKFNDSLILIIIISCNYLNLSLPKEYVGDVTIPNQVIKYNQNFLRRISQSDCSIQIKLNYSLLYRTLQGDKRHNSFLDYTCH